MKLFLHSQRAQKRKTTMRWFFSFVMLRKRNRLQDIKLKGSALSIFPSPNSIERIGSRYSKRKPSQSGCTPRKKCLNHTHGINTKTQNDNVITHLKLMDLMQRNRITHTTDKGNSLIRSYLDQRSK